MLLELTCSHSQDQHRHFTKSFSQFPVTIGRLPGHSSDSHLTLENDPTVSKLHATILYENAQLYVIDDSSNGTFINGAQITTARKTIVHSNDNLLIGRYTVVLTLKSPKPAHTASFSAESTKQDALFPAPPPATDPFGDRYDHPHYRNAPVGNNPPKGLRPESAIDDNTPNSKSDSSMDKSGTAPTDRIQQDPDQMNWILDVFKSATNPDDIQPQSPNLEPPNEPPGRDDNSSDTDLLSLLLRQSGVNQQNFSTAISPHLAGHIGVTLNKLTRCIMQILRSRREIRDTLRSDITRLRAQNNNPLEFSATAEEALDTLLDLSNGTDTCTNYIDEAMINIKAHELAMLAAMQESLNLTLDYFDPDVLADRIRRNYPISASLPVYSDAMMWGEFKAHFRELKEEVMNDFGGKFNQQLKEAYEKRVAELKQTNK